jgi:hypothetical protein
VVAETGGVAADQVALFSVAQAQMAASGSCSVLHQLVTLVCPCGHHTTAVAPAEAVAPVSYGPRLAGIGVYLLHGQFLSV